MRVPPLVLDALREAVGATNVVVDPDVVASHSIDWTGRWRGKAPAVVRPVTVDQVQRLVLAARAHSITLVPQGGNTGLVGGATPLAGEVVVDLRGLTELAAVDAAAAQVTVGAGVTLRALQEHVAPHGLSFGVDLGARDTATIGGMVATNAGGTHVVRHGSMRAQVLGIEAVLGTGDVVRINLRGLLKDNTGFDLSGLLCGSEGTLGIITTVRLRLVPTPTGRAVILVGFSSIESAVGALPALRRSPSLQAVEVMLAGGVAEVAAHLGISFPLAPVPPVTLLVELAGEDPMSELGGVMEDLDLPEAWVAVGGDDRAMAGLWRWREAHPEAVAVRGLVHKADVTLPHEAMAAFVDAVPAAIEEVAPGALTLVYGHLADGNLHVNVVGPDREDDRAVDAVLELVLRHGGSVSAEHGIGVAKRVWLVRQRGPEAVAAMRAIKGALDPDGILNPGVLLP